MAFQSKSASCLSVCWKHFYFTVLSGPQRNTYCSPTPRKKISHFFFLKRAKKQNKTKKKKEENCIFCRPKYCFLTGKSDISKCENIFCLHAISVRLRSPRPTTSVSRCEQMWRVEDDQEKKRKKPKLPQKTRPRAFPPSRSGGKRSVMRSMSDAM